MADGAFSLERLEYLAYKRSHEEAAAEILRLLEHLSAQLGGLGDIGSGPTGNQAAEYRDAHFATRIASVVAALFADPNFHLSDPGFRRLIPLQRWLSIIFGASPLGNADHIIHVMNEQGYQVRGQITLSERDLLKFCLLYSLDSTIPLQADVLWQKNKQWAGALFMALLSSRIVASPQAHNMKEQLLGWFPQRLKELSLDDFPVEILHDVWMHCSYAERADKHAIKRAINELVRQKLLSLGVTDVAVEPRKKDRPIALCVVEWFNSSHSIYRTHSLSMEALRAKYRVVGISLREATDDITRKVFDEVHVLPKTDSLIDAVQKVRAIAAGLQPDLVYYPSAGMFLDTVFLLNLRLAPIQMIALGHPATTHSPFVDYVLVEEDYVGDPGCFSEKLVALPPEAIPYRPRADCPKIAPRRRKDPDRIRVAVAASLMKVNVPFLNALRAIAQRSRVPIEFQFFPGIAFGLTKVYLQNLVRRVLPEWAVVYPHLPYDLYLSNINRCDMFVNPFPFGNTNGIVDTVRQGLPGVCLTGPEVHTHIDEALFRRLGLPDWLIAHSVEEYVRAAVRLAEDGAERDRLSQQILQTDPDAVLFAGRPELFLQSVEWVCTRHGTGELGSSPLRPPRDLRSAA